jgi:hypothetical protein
LYAYNKSSIWTKEKACFPLPIVPPRPN